jgi:hypothetical protein
MAIQTYQRSPLGAFRRSALGARNRAEASEDFASCPITDDICGGTIYLTIAGSTDYWCPDSYDSGGGGPSGLIELNWGTGGPTGILCYYAYFVAGGGFGFASFEVSCSLGRFKATLYDSSDDIVAVYTADTAGMCPQHTSFSYTSGSDDCGTWAFTA